METYSLTCKNCGAPLTVAKSAREATCNHCGTTIGITPTKREPDIVILDSPRSAKPPVRPRSAPPVDAELVEKPYDPAEQRRKKEEEEIRLARHGANLLDAVTGYRSCLHMIIIVTILGGLLTCGMCGLPGLLTWNQQGQVSQQAHTVTARAERTDDMLETAAGTINLRTRANQALPSADLGNALIDRYRDEWGRGLRYEKNSASSFVIRSAGRDGVFDTADDRIERTHAPGVRNTSQKALPPADLAAAIDCLQTPGLYQKDAALEWLIAEKPELDEAQRSAIVEASIPLLKESRQRPLAQNALTLWAQPADAPKLVRAAEQAQPREHDFVDTIVIQLIRLKDEESVLAMMNYPSGSVRASVAVAMKDWNVTDDRIALQSIEDLDREGRQEAALVRLKLMDLDTAQRDEVATRAKRMLMEGESSSLGALALDLLEQYDKVDTALLIKIYDSHNGTFERESELRDRAGQALTERPDPSVFLLFASQLASRDSRAAERGVTNLKIMGPAAESYVWLYLRSDDAHQRERACNLLAAIGTEKSLPHLLRIAVDGPTGSHAEAAIIDIQNANRQPVELPPATSATPATPAGEAD